MEVNGKTHQIFQMVDVNGASTSTIRSLVLVMVFSDAAELVVCHTGIARGLVLEMKCSAVEELDVNAAPHLSPKIRCW